MNHFDPTFDKTEDGFLLFRLCKTRAGIPRDDSRLEILCQSYLKFSNISITQENLLYPSRAADTTENFYGLARVFQQKWLNGADKHPVQTSSDQL